MGFWNKLESVCLSLFESVSDFSVYDADVFLSLLILREPWRDVSGIHNLNISFGLYGFGFPFGFVRD